MPTYLHEPVRDGLAVAGLKSDGASEGQHLDFKGAFWEDAARRCRNCGTEVKVAGTASVEAAKDVAAMANAFGGDIIVGIDDTGDRASGWWGGNPIPADADETLRKWLRNSLAPRDAADVVEVSFVTATDLVDGTDHRALIVNVAPWGYGPVAVQTEIDPQKARYFFPIRRERDTVYLSFEEIMRLNEGSRRGMYLKLHAMLPAEDNASETLFQLRSMIVGPHPIPLGSRHGTIRKVTPEFVVLAFDTLQYMTGWTGSSTLSVPLELVAAVWRDPDHHNLVSLALSTSIMWDGMKWVFGAVEMTPVLFRKLAGDSARGVQPTCSATHETTPITESLPDVSAANRWRVKPSASRGTFLVVGKVSPSPPAQGVSAILRSCRPA